MYLAYSKNSSDYSEFVVFFFLVPAAAINGAVYCPYNSKRNSIRRVSFRIAVER